MVLSNSIQGGLVALAFFCANCFGQNFQNYINITTGSPPAFSCNNNVQERILLRDPCGTLISPCYPMNYINEIPNGFKLWDLNAFNGTAIAGYRFTIESFETNPAGGYLVFNPTISFDSETNTNRFVPSERELLLSGRASTSPGVLLNYMNQPDENRGVNGTFFLNGTQYFIAFYSSRLPPEPGLRISYCADFDLCNTNTICDSEVGGTCVRNGFRDYSCRCNPGFNGSNCTNINECNQNSTLCDYNADCIDTRGSFRCLCRIGFSGDGRSCYDIDECSDGFCSPNSYCQNTFGSFSCICMDGFSGNGRICLDMNECSDAPMRCGINAAPDSFGDCNFGCVCIHGCTGNEITSIDSSN